jgi:serine/threonine protein kinase
VYPTATDMDTGEDMAVKLQYGKRSGLLLTKEAPYHEKLSGGRCIPTIHMHGQEAGYSFVVMDLLGPSLEDLFDYCGRQFSLKTVLMIADQLLCGCQYLHSRKVVHNDIKPGNLTMGTGRNGNRIYIIDFGSAMEYSATNPPLETDDRFQVGTTFYASAIGSGKGGRYFETQNITSISEYK